jgi:hypothetical protein
MKLDSAAMTWKTALNAALTRTTGYEVRRAGAWRRRRGKMDGSHIRRERLVEAPIFVLCTLRSGSTLLRVLLDSHSQLYSPSELHFRYVAVKLTKKWGRRAMHELGLDERHLEYLLWDRILHRELSMSGKDHIVCKTPNDVFIVDRLVECWPDARFIFLLRHPAASMLSRESFGERVDPVRNLQLIRSYCEALERARQIYPGYEIRYENLTADPEGTMKGVCRYLGVPWEPAMVDYGRFEHGRYRTGIGDFKEKIRTGRVQPAASLPAPEDVPHELREFAIAWGYLQPEAPRDDLPAAEPASA